MSSCTSRRLEPRARARAGRRRPGAVPRRGAGGDRPGRRASSWSPRRPRARRPSRWSTSSNPTLVLMDINMGAMDGLEATRQIIADASRRRWSSWCRPTPRADMPPAARTCGAAAYVNKDELSPTGRASAVGSRRRSGLGDRPTAAEPAASRRPPCACRCAVAAGTSAADRWCRAPGALIDLDRAAERAHAVAHVDEAVAVAGAAVGVEAGAVVGDLPVQRARRPRHTRTVAAGVARRRACRRSAAPPCSRSRPPPRSPGRGGRRAMSVVVGSAARAGSGRQRLGQAARRSSSGGKMPWASARSSAIAVLQVAADLVDHRLGVGRVVVDRVLRQPQLDRQRHEVLLRAVVQVALELAALGVAGGDDARTATRAARRWCAQLVERRLQRGVELHVVQRERRPGGRAR